jgi:hypothetical protein
MEPVIPDAQIDTNMASFLIDDSTGDVVDPNAPAPAAASKTYTEDDMARIRAEARLEATESTIARLQPGQAPAATPAAPVAPATPTLAPLQQAIAEANAKGIYDDPTFVTARALEIQSERHEAKMQAMLDSVRREFQPAVSTIQERQVIDLVAPGATPAQIAALAPYAKYFNPETLTPEQKNLLELAAIGAETKSNQQRQTGAPTGKFTRVSVNQTDFAEHNAYRASMSLPALTPAEYAKEVGS